MSYKPRSLFSLIEQIQNSNLFLPHLQRPFVWDQERMLRLFDSLMRSYPIQTFLFWRTKAEIRARRFMEAIDTEADLHTLYHDAKSQGGVEKTFVLDGQQRLQTLFSIFAGGIKEAQILEAWFDVTSGVPQADDNLAYRLEFAGGNPMAGDALGLLVRRLTTKDQRPAESFYRVRDLLGADSQRNPEDIADSLNDRLDAVLPNEDAQARSARQKRVRRNFGQLNSLLRDEKHFWVQELDGVANTYGYSTILDIFVRVNSGGTKLDPADLMFAAMKSEWDSVELKIEEIVTLLNGEKLGFDKSFVLKALILAHGAGATVTPDKFTSTKPRASGFTLLQEVEKEWDKADAAFEQLRDFIQQDLKLFHGKVVSSYVSFIPLFAYLFRHPNPTPENRARMKAFYYSAQFFNWFSASTDARLNQIHETLVKAVGSDFPLSELRQVMAKNYGAGTKLDPHHLQSSRVRSAILNLVYVETNSTSPFDVAYKENEPHVDHIYPRSRLVKLLDANGSPTLSAAEINHIGNFRYVGASDNRRKRAELPALYFKRLQSSGVDLHRHLLVPGFASNPERLLFVEETYRLFRETRAKHIYEIVARVVNHA